MLYSYCSRGYARLALLPCLFLIFYGCKGDVQAKKASYMQRGEAYVANEKYAEAIIEFRNVIKLDPKDAQAYYKIALVYIKQGGKLPLQNAFGALQQSVA